MAHQDSFKPLFNRRLLREAVNQHPVNLDEEQRTLALNWAASATGPALLGQKEKPLQGQFLSEVFDRLLGYRQIVGSHEVHHLEPETSSTSVKGYNPPDARLGWFGAGLDRTRVVVELKAPGADLDAKQGAAYGKLTPVEQAFGYAAKVDGCRWVVLSNFQELRLYRTERGQGYCQRFKLAELADPNRLAEFVFLLGRTTLLGAGPDDPSAVDTLANHTHVEQERITKAFYLFYRGLRLELFNQLRAHNPGSQNEDAEAHDIHLLELAQKILDRCLFICFCEDTGLLPAKVLTQALTAKSEGFVTASRWQQLSGLFRAIDQGWPEKHITAYNGGLFAADPVLDGLNVPDACLDGIGRLADYDFETDLNVNILGHIFEQSISDLESIRGEIRGGAEPGLSRRKRDGVFYTPEPITQFIVSRAIGGWLAERYAEVEARHQTRKGPVSKQARLKIAYDCMEVLRGIKILDPACGSGAFLVAAFDFLRQEYERVNRLIAELTGAPQQIGLYDLDRQILQDNLYGVDLNHESVEITKLSLWLKTARRDKPLNNLDHTIRCGNSLIEPPAIDAPADLIEAFAQLPPDTRAFDWRTSFPEVFARGGFDIVIGNPPYVRQELLGPFKPWLSRRYATWHGVADLYVYFYERGMELLAPDGKLGYIVTNKWQRAGYGEPLRRYFSERAEIEEIVDFGHAPIFEDADTFPCILVARPRPVSPGAEPPMVSVCPVPRDRSAELSLENYIHEHGYPVPWSRYGAEPWSLEPPDVDALMEKIRTRGVPLSEFVSAKPYRGVLTGLNEAFLIDDATRLRLIRDDPGCADIIKPYLRGQDIKRWTPDWQGLWMIFTRRGIDINAYPSVRAHLEGFRERLEPKPSDWTQSGKGEWPGRKAGKYAWFEIQDSVEYWERFDEPKILYQEIQFHPSYAFSKASLYGNNKVFLLPSSDLYLLAVLNSPLMWWHNWRYLPHMKDEALNPAGFRMESLPIAEPTAGNRAQAEAGVTRLIELTRESQERNSELLAWLRVEFAIDTPGQRLEAYARLTEDECVAEVRKRRPKGASRLTPQAIAELAKTHRHYADADRARAASTQKLERDLSTLVNRCYGLSDADIDLLWRTAPPRMPHNGS